MPLSEHEQRQLEQIEQALYRENRRLGRLVRSRDPRVHYRRRVVQAASGFVIGAGMVAAGVIFLIFGALVKFRFGYLLFGVLLCLHALLGYVELGTDSWIGKITGSIMDDPKKGLLLFVYTSGLMFALRFFAGAGLAADFASAAAGSSSSASIETSRSTSSPPATSMY